MKTPALWLATVLLLFVPARALACGGTFCDRGPTAMPVDQSGENILFVVGDGRVQAHVQIQYEGDAERFAWVLPLPSLPDVRVGSEALFVNLLNGTVPTYGLAGTLSCPILAINGGGGGVGLVDQTQPPPARVLRVDTVGAFEVTIVEGSTGDSILAWLDDNGYEDIPEASALFDEYVADGMLFAAIKLTATAGTDEIHPLVFEYDGDEPMIPIQLTRVAAVDDMRVRAFVLAGTRYVPINYRHMQPNPFLFDWVGFAPNYVDVVSRAADAESADGHAFLTEYAGPSSVVSQAGLVSATWDASPFIDLPAGDVVARLAAQGIFSCGGGTCTANHPMILPLLAKYLPVPDGILADDFYSCVGCWEVANGAIEWDSGQFAVNYQERIVLPGRDAVQLLASYPYVTRLFTTISPDEMDVDPVFGPRDDQGDVVPARTAGLDYSCGSDVARVNPPDSDQWVYLDSGLTWPDFGDDMPALAKLESFERGGEPELLVDNTEQIAEVVTEWNDAHTPTVTDEPDVDFVQVDVGSDGTVNGDSAPGTAAGSMSAPTGAMTSDTTGDTTASADNSVQRGSSGCALAPDPRAPDPRAPFRGLALALLLPAAFSAWRRRAG